MTLSGLATCIPLIYSRKIAQLAISEFQRPSLLKRGQVQNLSCENEFYLHDNEKSFSQERFCTWPHFKTEACGISEMTYM